MQLVREAGGCESYGHDVDADQPRSLEWSIEQAGTWKDMPGFLIYQVLRREPDGACLLSSQHWKLGRAIASYKRKAEHLKDSSVLQLWRGPRLIQETREGVSYE